uniref:hypothetical protein n=1 Tax=Veillonella magna TaxID=464322 RepID=UPI0023F1FE77
SISIILQYVYVGFLILTCTIYILAPILKLNETKLNISKESTKKGSEAILEQPQENTFKNVEEDML